MSICPIFPSGPLVPSGACFIASNNIDETVAAFKKCCGPAPIAQAYNSGAHVCLVYCPVVEDGPTSKEISDCVVSEIGTCACMGSRFASPSDVERASELAKTTGLCSVCLEDRTTTVQTTAPSTTDSESNATETASDTTAETTATENASDTAVESTRAAPSNTATATASPTRPESSPSTTATTSATSTNAAVGMYYADPIPWKVGLTMGAMLFTGAIAGLLI
ncbi:hypothetical protein V8C42DRAFT_290703 [Trichoderma barbatum]